MSDDATDLAAHAPGEPLRDRIRRRPLGPVTLAIGASLLIVLLAVSRLVVATGHSDGKNPLPTSPVRLTGLKASPIESLPVPKQAVLDGPVQGDSAEYTIPASAKVANAWYFDHLRPGQSWRGWTWVGPGEQCIGHVKGFSSLWQWERPGETLALYVYPSLADRGFGAVTIDIQRQLPFCQTPGP